MGWQFLSDDDRRKLTGELAKLDRIWEGSTGRSTLLTMAGLANLISRLNSLANSAAEVFAAELVSALENETTLPEQPHHQALGLLLEYVLLEPDIPRSTQELCAYMIGRYRLIDDEKLLARLAAEYGAPKVVTPWRESRREIAGRLSADDRLKRLMVASVVGALALLVVVMAVNNLIGVGTATPTVETPTVGPVISEYQVALTVGEECPAEWQDLAAQIKENVDAATPARTVAYVAPEEADLVLTLACDAELVAWTAQWPDPAPIFEIVGSPQKVQIDLPLNLADSELLGRALIFYGQNNYESARNALTELASRNETTALQLLYANTLLLTEEYISTVEAFTKIIDTAEGDDVVLAYNNRGLAHLDEYHRLETNQISEEKQRQGLGDLAEAQKQLTADSAPKVKALVNSNVGIMELLLMFPDDDMEAIVQRADAACRAAQAADPTSAWMRVCLAAVVIDPRKFARDTPCETGLYADADRWLLEVQEQEQKLAAVYYWRALLLSLNYKGCHITPTGENDFMKECVDWKQNLITLQEGGWAPLYLHVYLEDVFTRCSVFIPEAGIVPRRSQHDAGPPILIP